MTVSGVAAILLGAGFVTGLAVRRDGLLLVLTAFGVPWVVVAAVAGRHDESGPLGIAVLAAIVVFVVLAGAAAGVWIGQALSSRVRRRAP